MIGSLRESQLIGLDQPATGVWHFVFSQADLNIESPWRLVDAGAVVLSGSDHGHKFGLANAVDVCTETLRVLRGKVVERTCIDETTADLCITFSEGTRIDIFNNSGGYEGWQFGDRNGLNLVAQGGGQVAIWDTRPVTQK